MLKYLNFVTFFCLCNGFHIFTLFIDYKFTVLKKYFNTSVRLTVCHWSWRWFQCCHSWVMPPPCWHKNSSTCQMLSAILSNPSGKLSIPKSSKIGGGWSPPKRILFMSSEYVSGWVSVCAEPELGRTTVREPISLSQGQLGFHT